MNKFDSEEDIANFTYTQEHIYLIKKLLDSDELKAKVFISNAEDWEYSKDIVFTAFRDALTSVLTDRDIDANEYDITFNFDVNSSLLELKFINIDNELESDVINKSSKALTSHVSNSLNELERDLEESNNSSTKVVRSLYQNYWEMLKEHNKIEITLQMTEVKSHNLAIFKKLRKAISNCKAKDTDFKATYPHARIKILTADPATGKVILELTQLINLNSLSDLVRK